MHLLERRGSHRPGRAVIGRLLVVAAVAVLGSGVLEGAQRARAEPAAVATSSPTLVGTGRVPAPRQGSFLSLSPACGCGRGTVLEQFALSDGRRLGALAQVTGSPDSVSDPHVGPGGDVWLTLASGPRYRSGDAGGDPAPDSCSGRVVRFDPSAQKTATVLTLPSSVLVSDAVPSPNGRLVVLPVGGCSTSFFNEHLIVRDLATGAQWTIGADAAPCHALFKAEWSADSTQLVFPYGPSILSPHTHFVPAGTCASPRFSRLVVVSASHASSVSSWKLIKADDGCSYMAATFDRTGIAAIEGCTRGHPPGDLNDPNGGDAYLVQLNSHRRIILRLPLARGYDGGDIATDPQTGTVLVSEYQGANQGIPVFDWVWAYDGHRLRTIRRFANEDAATVIAEPW
jgi:hypothetical protein